ncbi:MAG: hypothetical protein KDE48_07475, partial [Anaerolineales bacterium]|nr:hypothetical protein [Anaerolineales bacterium]
LTTVDHGGYSGTSLALNSNGFAVISYFRNFPDSKFGALQLAVCNNIACDNPVIRQIDFSEAIRDISLVLNSSGFPIISYFDDVTDNLMLAVCNDATCTSPVLTIVDDSGDVGGYTSLALNSNGYPVISYQVVYFQGSFNYDLKV